MCALAPLSFSLCFAHVCLSSVVGMRLKLVFVRIEAHRSRLCVCVLFHCCSAAYSWVARLLVLETMVVALVYAMNASGPGCGPRRRFGSSRFWRCRASAVEAVWQRQLTPVVASGSVAKSGPVWPQTLNMFVRRICMRLASHCWRRVGLCGAACLHGNTCACCMVACGAQAIGGSASFLAVHVGCCCRPLRPIRPPGECAELSLQRHRPWWCKESFAPLATLAAMELRLISGPLSVFGGCLGHMFAWLWGIGACWEPCAVFGLCCYIWPLCDVVLGPAQHLVHRLLGMVRMAFTHIRPLGY